MWRALARRGAPILVTVKVDFDKEARVFVARDSNLRGLIAEAPTLDELAKNIDAAIADLLEDYLHEPPARRPVTSMTFDNLCAA